MELGKKIRQLRAKAGLTQEQLAERLGIGPQSVSKWETGVAMPDISLLPTLAEVFGVTIDDLFDLTVEQRLNRIENRMDVEDELPGDVFLEYEEFLRAQLANEAYRKRATTLTAYLYWHRMNACAQKVRRFAKEAIRMSPGEKECQWLLCKAEGHVIWDWNLANHSAAIDFYRELAKANPGLKLPYEYLIDNLLADHRADEAAQALEKLRAIRDSNPILNEVYRAHIALARFDAPAADRIIEQLTAAHPDNSDCLFEAAQYYAMKCDYPRAIEYYERAFDRDPRRPRYQDALMGIAEIYRIMGEPRKAADTYGRIVDLLRNEWGMTEEVELRQAQQEQEKLRMIEKR